MLAEIASDTESDFATSGELKRLSCPLSGAEETVSLRILLDSTVLFSTGTAAVDALFRPRRLLALLSAACRLACCALRFLSALVDCAGIAIPLLAD